MGSSNELAAMKLEQQQQAMVGSSLRLQTQPRMKIGGWGARNVDVGADEIGTEI